MTSRPSLARSTPFIILLIASVASTALGAWIALSKLSTMTATLTATTQKATGALDVYAGGSWIVFGAALATAGLIGLFIALAVATLRSFVPVVAEDEPAAAPEPAAELPFAPADESATAQTPPQTPSV
ncbi:hypothetical protein LK09_13515 [Microbacterium mangrovi]|uniref:Dinucleotide-utilizing enzyme n=1 Tax=Microbacterium mangrovi TaxID=1348253 RepID=A0A0B2A1F8_9MICO|nr:hypothetical protein [Microbacterium mangrovi]KHK96866.1 hypothetical protein LK09_13515 [Microbacterium mangrovi]